MLGWPTWWVRSCLISISERAQQLCQKTERWTLRQFSFKRLLSAVEQDPTYPSYCSLHFRLFTFTGITTKLPPAI